MNAVRNAIGIGLAGIISLFGGVNSNTNPSDDLLTESGNHLVQEDGGLIVLE